MSVVVLSVASAAGWIVWKKRQGVIPGVAVSAPSDPPPKPVPAKALAPKSPDDLKRGPVTIERTSGGGLVYAVGTIRNESDHQRFGVKVELELADASGKMVGTAKDYARVIEPRQSWHFRALVLEAKAASAQISSIQEEE
jgi:hypothetical protein